MARVFPLPAPARISTGPSVVSTASRCCGLSWLRKDKVEKSSKVSQVDFTGIRDRTELIRQHQYVRFLGTLALSHPALRSRRVAAACERPARKCRVSVLPKKTS